MDLPGIILSRSSLSLHSARRAISRDRGFSQSCFGFQTHYPLNRKQNCKQIAAKRDAIQGKTFRFGASGAYARNPDRHPNRESIRKIAKWLHRGTELPMIRYIREGDSV